MVAKSITKLIDEAIIPAMFLILAKLVGLFASAYILNLQFEIKSRSFLGILPSLSFATLNDYVRAENYSNLAMLAAVSLGCALILIQAHYLHVSHIHPRLHAKLVSLNLESLVSSSFHLYHQAAIWLIFLWLTTGFLILSSILQVTYAQISLIAFVVAANFSWLFAIDVEKEIELSGN